MTPRARSRKPTAASLAAAESRLEQRSRDNGQRLSPMRRAVFRQMLAEAAPQTAYQVLDGVRITLGKKVAPLSVYRALDFLEAEGWVHRLESLRAFRLCEHPGHAHAGVLFLCSGCGGAEEAEDRALESLIERGASRRGFHAERRVVEVLGRCRNCAR